MTLLGISSSYLSLISFILLIDATLGIGGYSRVRDPTWAILLSLIQAVHAPLEMLIRLQRWEIILDLSDQRVLPAQENTKSLSVVSRIQC